MLQLLKRELLAGITVSIVALPLALAFGMQATGNSDGAIIGLYGAIITGFFAALFGGTPRQVTGPTAPITIIVTGIIAQYGLTYAFIAAFMSGLIQIGFGYLKLGNYLKFIPLPVVSGFMNGIAILIIISQIKYLTSSTLVVLISIVLMFISMKKIKAFPASLMALILGSIAVLGLENILPSLHIGLPFIGEISLFGQVERIGEIPKGLPQFHLPIADLQTYILLLPSAFSIAILASIDSLLTSVVMDNISGTKHNSNKELIGQGIGNTIAGLFGGMAGAGATVRSIVNLKSGGETALSAMFHSIALLSFMLVLGDFASGIPLAVLAGILIVTGITMFDIESIRVIKDEPRSDAIAMLTTMVLTIVVDLMVAVGVGIVLSSLIFMKRMSEEGVKITNTKGESYSIFVLDGPLYFGSIDSLNSKLLAEQSAALILDLSRVPVIDATGALAIIQINKQLQERNQTLYLIGLQKNVKVRLRKMKVFDSLGKNHRFNNVDETIFYLENGYRKSHERNLRLYLQ